MMVIEEIRSLYPYLKTGMIYMNHAAVSPLSTPVVQTIQKYLEVRSENGIENFRLNLDVFTRAKQKTAALINAQPDRIAFCDNTSNGLNLLAQGLQWKPGDRIILNDIEFPSNVYPFMNLQRDGVEIDFVKSKNGVVSAEDIIAAVTSATKLISISFVQFLSGYRADLELLGNFCRDHNIVFSVDGIQGLGALPLDVQKCKIDFLASGTQKWLMGKMGLAFVYLTEALQERLQPKYVGWLSVENAWNILDFDLKLRKTAEAFQNGTLNALGIYGYLASLELFEQTTQKQREEIVLSNSEYFIEELLNAGYKPLLAGIERKYLSGIVTFPADEPQALFEKISKENIVCSLREGLIRFSPHYYNTKEEIDQVISVIKS